MFEGTFGYIWFVFHDFPVSPLCILEALNEALTAMSTHIGEGDPQRCKPDIPGRCPNCHQLSIHVSTLRIILWYKFCYVYLVHVFWSFHVLSARHFYTCSLLLAHLPREAMLCDPSYGCCSGTLGILAFRIPCNAWGSWNRGQPRREMQPCHSWMRWQHV